MMKSAVGFLILFFLFPSVLQAQFEIAGNDGFIMQIKAYLSHAKNMSTYLQRLINEAESTPATITMKPITDDQATWHRNGEKFRSHTEALDDKGVGTARSKHTDSVIFINTDRIDPNHNSYKNGTLIHEIVHALDLAAGHYNGEYQTREKRAVFFENIWRDRFGKRLRSHYHHKFATTDYQSAKANQSLDDFVNHYFISDNLP